MDPEDHLTVKFLRHLKFNEAADKFVEFLSNPEKEKIVFCNAVGEALRELIDCKNKRSLLLFTPQAALFEKIANTYGLKELSSPFVESESEKRTITITPN